MLWPVDKHDLELTTPVSADVFVTLAQDNVCILFFISWALFFCLLFLIFASFYCQLFLTFAFFFLLLFSFSLLSLLKVAGEFFGGLSRN